MKGYMQIVAFSTIASLLSHYYGNILFSALYILWIGFLYWNRRLGKQVLLCSAASLLFFFFYFPPLYEKTSISEPHSEKYAGQGEIIKPPNISDKRIEFILKEKDSGRLLLVLYFHSEDQMDNKQLSKLKHGALCMLEGVSEHPQSSRNPGQFDYRKYLYTKNISNQVIIASLDDIVCKGESFWHRFYQLRNFLINHIESIYDPYTASWANSLVFGDDSKLDKEIVQLLQRWGLSHLIAISGTHVGILIAFLYFVLRKGGVVTKEKLRQILIFFLPFYAFLAGGDPPVLRACFMVIVFLFVQKWQLKFPPLDVLSLIYLFFLLYNPYFIFHVGFQLSFLVTFGLVLARNWLFQVPNTFMQLLRISFVSQMVIIPLQLHYFTIFEPLSILLNVIIVPYFSLFVIPFMYILVILSLCFPLPKIGMLFSFIHEKIVSIIFLTDQYFRHPFLADDIPFLWIGLYYIVFYLLMKKLIEIKRKQAFGYGMILTGWFILIAVHPYFSPTGKVTMLDIGQGDAFVIELPYRKGVIMVDAGTRYDYAKERPSEHIYEQIIKPFLYASGIKRIDSLVITHEDLDHNGSMPFMIKDGMVDQIIISNYYDVTEEERKLWKEHGIEVTRVGEGDVLSIAGQQIFVLGPEKDYASSNGNSLILFTSFGEYSWLFTGDIEQEQEMALLHRYPNLNVDVLKVAHHGSATSTAETFLQQINPEIALISVGENNPFHHPSPDVIARLQNKEIEILRTDEHGAVQFIFGERSGTFFTYLP